jgi:hypothetical protein
MMKNTNRCAKKEDVHPLCSRKRSLMKIVDSPSYQKRRALEKEKENTLAEKKAKTETPKFDYLRRTSRYGDDFHINKPESRKSFGGINAIGSSSAKPVDVKSKQDDGSLKTPLRGRTVEQKKPSTV